MQSLYQVEIGDQMKGFYHVLKVLSNPSCVVNTVFIIETLLRTQFELYQPLKMKLTYKVHDVVLQFSKIPSSTLIVHTALHQPLLSSKNCSCLVRDGIEVRWMICNYGECLPVCWRESTRPPIRALHIEQEVGGG